jgi:hypothetical protein
MKWFKRRTELTAADNIMLQAIANTAATPTDVIIAQMNEPRPLPMGRQEFEVWSDRIISGAMIKADVPSLKFALAEMIMHLKPTDSHCNDAHFIHSLRKGAANQVAFAMMEEIRDARKKALAEQDEAAKLKLAAAPPSLQVGLAAPPASFCTGGTANT